MSVRAAEPPASNPAFAQFLTAYYEDFKALFPVEAAISGDPDPRYESVWPNDLTPEFRAKVVALCDRTEVDLGKFDRAELTESEQLSYDTLRWTLQIRRDRTKTYAHLLPVNQMSSSLLDFAQMGSGAFVHPFKTNADYRHFLARATQFSLWVDTAIANMREGVEKNIVLPQVLVDRVIAQLEPLSTDDPKKNVFYQPLEKLPADAEPNLRADYETGIRTVILPAYARMKAFLVSDYRSHCRATSGVGDLPQGKEFYAYCIRAQTTTDLNPTAIHELGLKEVARIRGEIEALKTRLGFKGTYNEFLDSIDARPELRPFNTPEDVLNGYRSIQAKVDAAVPRFFRSTPKADFEIRRTESFRERSASPEYVPGTPDGSRPGIFYVPILNAKRKTIVYMTDLFLHEAIPGHHFQLSLALENPALPTFRRIDANNAYTEGWALYCEPLGEQMGVYETEWQRLGFLLNDLLRAERLVVDTGLHALGWSREKAMAYKAEQEDSTPEAQATDIERYMALPGQALGYKLGQLKILELRAKAQAALGARFDIRDFHQAILGEGALPLGILEAHVNAWIAHQK